MNRTVLMISYWYPPTPGAGAQRAAGFARHLPAYGWRPVVVAATDRGASLSARLLGIAPQAVDDEGVSVAYVPDLAGAASVFTDYSGAKRAVPRESLLRQLVFPDRFAVWAGRARREAGQIACEQHPDVVWTSFPPASAAMAAGAVAAEFGLPLVLDLRDPWFGPGGYSPRRSRRQERLAELEAQLARQAAAIATISDAMSDDVCRRHDIPRERVHTITNGFDPARCVRVLGIEPRSPPELVHVGTVSQRNHPDLFLNALVSEVRAPLNWMVKFVGNLSDAYVHLLGLSGLVRAARMVSWEEAWKQMCRATALLLLVGEYVGRWGHNAKMFEYVRSGRPILCLEETPGSNDRRLLEQLAPERTVFASLTRPDEIIAGIGRVMELAREIPFGQIDESPGLMRYDRRRLAGELAAVLDRVATAGAEPRP